ncbi:hypothetical protein JYT72_01025 [Crocinitomix catalasitica]|nr:hypothetical protein [Crocinitomix catalasitica]
MKKSLYSALALTILFSSCQKDKKDGCSLFEQTTTSYSTIDVGNVSAAELFYQELDTAALAMGDYTFDLDCDGDDDLKLRSTYSNHIPLFETDPWIYQAEVVLNPLTDQTTVYYLETSDTFYTGSSVDTAVIDVYHSFYSSNYVDANTTATVGTTGAAYINPVEEGTYSAVGGSWSNSLQTAINWRKSYVYSQDSSDANGFLHWTQTQSFNKYGLVQAGSVQYLLIKHTSSMGTKLGWIKIFIPGSPTATSPPTKMQVIEWAIQK